MHRCKLACRAGLVLLASFAGEVSAQPIRMDPPLPQSVPLPQSMLDVSGPRAFRNTERFLVAGTFIHAAIDGTVSGSDISVRGTQVMRATYVVRGASSLFLTDLAGAAEKELRTGLAQLAIPVESFSDFASNPRLSAIPRQQTNAEYGRTTSEFKTPRTVFAVEAPAESQLFGGPDLRKHLQFKSLARELQRTIVIAELWFQSPQLEHELTGRNRTVNSMRIGAGLDMPQAALTFITPSGAVASVMMKRPLVNLEPVVGEMSRINPDPLQGRGRRKQTISQLYEFELIHPSYEAGVMRGARSFFRAAVEAIRLARR